MKQLLELLEAIQPLSEGLKNYLQLNMKRKMLAKKDILLREGQVCKNIYFVERGLLRCSYFKDDKDVSSWFMREGNILISVESFYNQIASYETIQALESSVLYYLEYEQLQFVYQNFPEFNFIGRVLTERYYAMSEQRLYSLRMQLSHERLMHFMRSSPELFSRVPSQYLASYLGLSNETLSRTKSKFKREFLTLGNFRELN